MLHFVSACRRRFSLCLACTTLAATTCTAAAESGSLTTLVTFDRINGWSPSSRLEFDSAGNLYGMTSKGGANGRGNIYKYSTGGVLTTLATFNGVNGIAPAGNFEFDSAGNLYGSTSSGGSSGRGGVFKLTTAGAIEPIISFNGSNGDSANAGVTFGSDGALYGTTQLGGTNASGTLFRLTTSGAHTVLASFTSGNGYWPVSGLTADAAGSFYGTTIYGGQFNGGIVFRLSKNAAGNYSLATLHAFNGNDGANPWAGVTIDADGNLYGATSAGNGTSKGTLFKLTRSASGSFTHSTLWTFTGTDGRRPLRTPVIDAAGNLFGTTDQGGSNDAGTIYRLTPAGTLSTLHSFKYTDGAFPSWLTPDAAGNLYGTTTLHGGPAEAGTLFKLTGAGFVVPEPTSGTVFGFIAASALLAKRCRTKQGRICAPAFTASVDSI